MKIRILILLITLIPNLLAMQADTKKNKSKYINGEVLKYIIY